MILRRLAVAFHQSRRFNSSNISHDLASRIAELNKVRPEIVKLINMNCSDFSVFMLLLVTHVVLGHGMERWGRALFCFLFFRQINSIRTFRVNLEVHYERIMDNNTLLFLTII